MHLERYGDVVASFMTPLLNRLLGHPTDLAAIVSPAGPSVTYGALDARSAEIATRLLAGRASLNGDRVALLLPPGEAFVATVLGIWRAGGVAVPLSALHTVPELEHILTTAAPVTTVVDPALAASLDLVV
ncbi:MAG: AMP-binding protein, partial [Myxococcales bacterium]